MIGRCLFILVAIVFSVAAAGSHPATANGVVLIASDSHRVEALQSCHKDCTRVRTADVKACQKITDSSRRDQCIGRANKDEDQCDRQCEKKYGKK